MQQKGMVINMKVINAAAESGYFTLPFAADMPIVMLFVWASLLTNAAVQFILLRFCSNRIVHFALPVLSFAASCAVVFFGRNASGEALMMLYVLPWYMLFLCFCGALIGTAVYFILKMMRDKKQT